jgi:hypothetical protein
MLRLCRRAGWLAVLVIVVSQLAAWGTGALAEPHYTMKYMPAQLGDPDGPDDITVSGMKLVAYIEVPSLGVLLVHVVFVPHKVARPLSKNYRQASEARVNEH